MKFDSSFFFNDDFFSDPIIVNGKEVSGIIDSTIRDLESNGNLQQITAHFISVSFMFSDVCELINYDYNDSFIVNGSNYKYKYHVIEGDTIKITMYESHSIRRQNK